MCLGGTFWQRWDKRSCLWNSCERERLGGKRPGGFHFKTFSSILTSERRPKLLSLRTDVSGERPGIGIHRGDRPWFESREKSRATTRAWVVERRSSCGCLLNLFFFFFFTYVCKTFRVQKTVLVRISLLQPQSFQQSKIRPRSRWGSLNFPMNVSVNVTVQLHKVPPVTLNLGENGFSPTFSFTAQAHLEKNKCLKNKVKEEIKKWEAPRRGGEFSARGSRRDDV